jgi:hypothetical protein
MKYSNILQLFEKKQYNREDVSGLFLSTIVSSMAVPPHLRGHIPYKHKKNVRPRVTDPDSIAFGSRSWLFGGSGDQVFNDHDCNVKHRNAELQFSKFYIFLYMHGFRKNDGSGDTQ